MFITKTFKNIKYEKNYQTNKPKYMLLYILSYILG